MQLCSLTTGGELTHALGGAQHKQAFCRCFARQRGRRLEQYSPARQHNGRWERKRRNATSCHATQDNKVLFGLQRFTETGAQPFASPDGAAGCSGSGVAAARGVRGRGGADFRLLMTAATPDEDWRTSVAEILTVWRSACSKSREASSLLPRV